MKKLTSIILFIAMLMSIAATTVVADSNLPFRDVKISSWFGPAVLTVHAAGIMEGKSEGKFEPNSPMTRAEFVTVLYRLSGEIVLGAEDNLTFTDVKKNAWYTEAVAWAVRRNLVSGYPDNTFRPNTPVLRQELAKMMVTFLEYMEITEKGTPLVDSFTDRTKFPAWAAEFIESLRSSGLMGGDDNGNFKPKANASRAEIATVLTRLLPLMDNEDESTEDSEGGNTEGSGSTNFVPPPAPDGFELCTEALRPYYIRFPEGYSEDTKYPLVIFTAGRGSVSIDSVGACFYSEESPLYDSIVMIPAVAKESDLEFCAELFFYVAKKYSVDSERVYLIATGEDHGSFFTWKMLEQFPSVVSAVLSIHGGISAVGSKENGGYILEGLVVIHYSDELHVRRISDEALKELQTLPIYHHHCTDHNKYSNDFIYPNYDDMLKSAFEDAGMNKTIVVEDTGYPTIYDDFAVRNNGAALKWLFEQKRATK